MTTGSPDAGEQTVARGRASGVARNSLFGFAAFLYPTILAIVLTPFIVHRLGAERYGLFSLATVLISVLGLLDFGMSPAIVKFISEAVTRPEGAREADRIIGVSLVFYGVVGGAGGAAAGLAGFFLLGNLFHVSTAARPLASFTFAIAGVGFLLTMVMAAFAAVPLGLQRFDLQARIRIALATSTASLTVVMLVIGFGLRGLIVAVAVEPLIGILFFARASRRLIPGLRPRPRWDRALLLRLMSFSGFAFLANVAGLVLFQLDRIVLGAVTGAAAVTFYVIPGSLAQRLHAGVSALANVVLPASSDLFARGETASVHRLYLRGTRIALAFLLSFAIPALCFARPILHYWLGPTFSDKSTTVLQLLVATYLVLGMTTIPYYLVLGAGRPRILAAFSILSGVLNVALISFLIPLYGITGAAAGYLATMAAVPPFIWYVERRVLGLTENAWPRILSRLGLPAAVQAIASFFLARLATNLGLTVALVTAAIPIFGAVWLGLRLAESEDRELVRQLLRARAR